MMSRKHHPAQGARPIYALVAVLVAVFVLVAPARPAVAAVTPQQDLESVIEEYDKVSVLLAADQAKAAGLGRTVTALDRQVAAARAQIVPVVKQSYEIGSQLGMRLVVDATTLSGLVDQVGLADAFTAARREAIGKLAAARGKDVAAKKSLDATVATLVARKKDLAVRKQTILAQLAHLRDVQAHVPASDLNDPSPLRPVACPFSPVGGAAAVAVAVACAQIGKPYVWAAAGPRTFDCSGLMVYAWAAAGRRLRHFTGFQFADLTPVKASQLRPGDLVFFFPPTMHHVGMYVGGGWMVVAPHTGDVVRMQKIDTLPIGGYRRV